MIFVTAFINKKVDRAETKSRQFIPNSGHAAAIFTCFEDKSMIQLSDGIQTNSVYTMKSNCAVRRVAKVRTIPPSSKAPVLVQTEELETYMVKATPMESDGSRIVVEKETLKTFPHQSFYVIVADTSKIPISVPKTMRVTKLGRAPSKML